MIVLYFKFIDNEFDNKSQFIDEKIKKDYR